jgi:hypothetical protein
VESSQVVVALDELGVEVLLLVEVVPFLYTLDV